MEISGNTPSTAPALTVALTNKGNSSQSSFKAGQQLLVSVLSSTSNNRATIDVGGKTFQAQTNIPLQAGQQFRAIATVNNKTNTETLTLTIINNKTNSETISRALRSAMPQQAPLAETFNNWAQLLIAASANSAATKAIPAAVLSLMREILGKLPSLSNIKTASNLKNALQHSGLFLESALATRNDQINVDLKAMLLKLAAQIQTGIDTTGNNKQLLEQLQRQTESALARIQLNQLQSLKQEGSAQPLLIEIPAWEKERLDNIRLLITKDKSGKQDNHNDDDHQQWQVRLQFNLPELGSVEASITFNNEQAGISFISKEAHTTDLFSDKLSELHEDLRDHGLLISHLSSQPGNIEPLEPHPTSTLFEAKA